MTGCETSLHILYWYEVVGPREEIDLWTDKSWVRRMASETIRTACMLCICIAFVFCLAYKYCLFLSLKMGTCLSCQSAVPLTAPSCLVCEAPLPPQLQPQASRRLQVSLATGKWGRGRRGVIVVCSCCRHVFCVVIVVASILHTWSSVWRVSRAYRSQET